MIRRQMGVALDHGDAFDWDAQFIGHDLRQGDAVAGAKVHLARIEHHAPLRLDDEIGIDLLGVDAPAFGRGARQVLRSGPAIHGVGHDKGAGAGEERAAVERHGHGGLPHLALAARRAALTMRSWAPQRQTFAASASRTCPEDGAFVLSRKAAVVMTIPLVQ